MTNWSIPLAAVNLNIFLDTLGGHELIMHGADYDLRLLQKHHQFIPGAIFDTMLAARLIGIRQFSLSNLVEQFLGVKLEKGAQKANWAMRPLTEKMERYARNDTHYLKHCQINCVKNSKSKAGLNGTRNPAPNSSKTARKIEPSTKIPSGE